MEKIVRYAADRGTIGHQRLMLPRCVFTPHFEAVNHAAEAAILAFVAGVRDGFERGLSCGIHELKD